jgi:hypothetical protein
VCVTAYPFYLQQQQINMDIHNTLLEVNKDNLLRFVSLEDIYKHYLSGKIVYNKPFSSPFRTDKNPSFVISKTSLWFKDYATGDSGDCFDFVNKLYPGDMNFIDILKQIIVDMGLQGRFMMGHPKTKPSEKREINNISQRGSYQGDFNLKVKARKWNENDLKYWKSYGISEKYLKLGDIYPISHYFINNKQFIAAKYAYAYVENKDGVESYKIYQPFSDAVKWINSNNYSVWELWRLLPKTYDKLIITSSRKDALSIIENFHLPATSFQAESINPKPHVVEEIKSRFEQVYLLYDNDFDNPDNPGQTLAEKRINEFGFTNLVLPEQYGCKDFSDLVYDYGVIKSCMILADVMDKADAENKKQSSTLKAS